MKWFGAALYAAEGPYLYPVYTSLSVHTPRRHICNNLRTITKAPHENSKNKKNSRLLRPMRYAFNHYVRVSCRIATCRRTKTFSGVC